MRRPVAIFWSSALATLSFPIAIYTSNLVPSWISSLVVWFMYVPLYLSLRNATPGQAFRWAYLFGLLSNGGILYWIVIAMQKYGGLSFLTSTATIGTLVLALAFYPAITFWLIARYRGIAPAWLLGSSAFVILEWTRTQGPIGGFPWATPAYALYSANILIQVGDLIGTEGLNFLIFLGNITIAEALVSKNTGRRVPRLSVSIFFLAFGLSVTYGYFRMTQVRDTMDRASMLRVALLQGNIPQDRKQDARHRRQVMETYLGMSEQALRQQPDLIVWPEAALPWTVNASIQSLAYVLPAKNNVPHVIGAASRLRKDGKRFSLNSSFVVDAAGRVESRYDKQHLVPFGEYVPFSNVLPIDKLVPPVAGNFSSGNGGKLGSVKKWKYGNLICYESLFPDLSIDAVRKGAHFLVNITNDAWFDETSGPYQHLRFGRFRAIETRRPIVRAANTGISGWFDAIGRLHEDTKLFTQKIILAEIAPLSVSTFYVRNPRFVPTLCAFLLLFSAAGIFRKESYR